MYSPVQSECPYCQKQLDRFVSAAELSQKKRWVKGLRIALVAWCCLALLMALLLDAFHPAYANTMPFMIGYLATWMIGMIVLFVPYRRWQQTCPKVLGKIVIEPDGTIHVHDTDTPLQENGRGPFGEKIYRSFIPVQPFLISCDLVAGATGLIFQGQDEWRKVPGWSVIVHDPFHWIDFVAPGETISWRSGDAITLTQRVQMAMAWKSQSELLAHLLPEGADPEAPLADVAQMKAGLETILNWVKEQSPQPLKGATVRALLEEALRQVRHRAYRSQECTAAIALDGRLQHIIGENLRSAG